MIKTKQELLNHFSDINTVYNNPFMYQTLSNMIDELLEQQPCDNCISRPKGTWDILSDDDGIYGICSVCQQDADFDHYGVAFDFCPNCGADMRGEQE